MSDELPLTTTTQLLDRYRGGEAAARDQIVARYMPLLRKWAHGRLPVYGRDLSETDDLVQVTLLRALNHLEDFKSERPGAFLSYLRTILMNLVREELRRRKSRPNTTSLMASMPSEQASVVEEAVGVETLKAYEAALETLSTTKRLAVVMRVEFDMSYPEIARELEQPSANSTRMMVGRALSELADAMGQ